MRHLRTIAGAAALALCLIGCAPQAAQQCPTTPDVEQVDDGGEGHERFGALPARDFALDRSTLADITTPVVADTGMQLLCFQVVIQPTGDPVGVLELEGSIDGVSFTDTYLDANKVYGTAAAWDGGTQVPVSDPAAAQTITFCVESPLPYMRVFYDRTSGGAAAGADFYTHALRNQ